ncbi:MAG: integrase, partial [Lachnospiraceae bacterium]|nr:integrase [Lachnospiraceae bacterium]
MNDSLTYAEQINQENVLKLRDLRTTLPKFLGTYFISVDQVLASRTKIAYAIDLKTFFEFIKASNPIYRDKALHDFGIDAIAQLNSTDINEYMEYLKLYETPDGKRVTNNERAIKRKMSAVRSMYNYFYKTEVIDSNPAIQVD